MHILHPFELFSDKFHGRYFTFKKHTSVSLFQHARIDFAERLNQTLGRHADVLVLVGFIGDQVAQQIFLHGQRALFGNLAHRVES